jgi:phage shock protein PspC (stress-responsive transcriptional regulator)
MKKRIYLPTKGKIIGGVCAGLGEYFDIDPTWIRILFVLTIFAQGVGLLAYLVAWIVIPRRPEILGAAPAVEVAQPSGASIRRDTVAATRGPSFLPGVILIGLGLIFLFNRLFFWFDFRYIWPLVLVGIGVVLIFHSVKPRKEVTHSAHAASEITEVNDERR